MPLWFTIPVVIIAVIGFYWGLDSYRNSGWPRK